MPNICNGKVNCYGCEGCAEVCPKKAITMIEDIEGFCYPEIDERKCVDCGLCEKVCPKINPPKANDGFKIFYGGYSKNSKIRDLSTSGGIFSTIVGAWKHDDYAVFGVEYNGFQTIHVCHNKNDDDIVKFRKSKYIQSHINGCYKQAFELLKEGKSVLFSGTPCQIAAFCNYPGVAKYRNTDQLLTVEVVCEGFPSPVYMRKYVKYLENKYGNKVTAVDYRYKDNKRWDYEVMKIDFQNGRTKKIDRWFNPFWIFWSDRLMSRPSCASCDFRKSERVADITLGDLWGVHKYCPDLYGNNGGATLIACNSNKGCDVLEKIKDQIYGHELAADEALKYQRPLRVIVPANPQRDEFMHDLCSMDYVSLCKKWNPKSSLKTLFSKYIIGNNQQVVMLWNLKHKLFKKT